MLRALSRAAARCGGTAAAEPLAATCSRALSTSPLLSRSAAAWCARASQRCDTRRAARARARVW
jgi:hypothetical protein